MQAFVTAPSPETEKLPAGRYEALIRLSEAIRTHPADDLFQVLVRELREVVQFDAVAQYDEELNKINWYMGERCKPGVKPSHDLKKEESIAWWVKQNQQVLVIGAVHSEERFPQMMDLFRQCGI